MNALAINPEPIHGGTARSKAVILLGQDDLLVTAVEHLFTARKGWKVIRISDTRDPEALVREVTRVDPEAVIVHQDVYFSNVRSLMRLVQDCPQLKVVTISLENNFLEVYNKQTICIKEASDLLSIIEEGADSDGRGGES